VDLGIEKIKELKVLLEVSSKKAYDLASLQKLS
jgi:hypothetical protein